MKYNLIDNQLHVANETLPEKFRYDPKTKGMKGKGGGAEGSWTPADDARLRELEAKAASGAQ